MRPFCEAAKDFVQAEKRKLICGEGMKQMQKQSFAEGSHTQMAGKEVPDKLKDVLSEEIQI